MGNLDLYERVRKVPKEAQKSITGGRLKGMTDINPMWRIKTLTEEFGPCGQGWQYKVINREFVPGANNTVAVFVDIELKYKLESGEWSEPVYGSGGSMFVAQETTKLYTDDEAPKKALTDAIGVACKALGVAADVYWDKDSTKYDSPPEDPPKQAKAVPAKQAAAVLHTAAAQFTEAAQLNAITQPSQDAYNSVLKIAREMINNVNDVESANVAMREMQGLKHVGDSKKFVAQMLKQRATELNLFLVLDEATGEKHFIDNNSDNVA